MVNEKCEKCLEYAKDDSEYTPQVQEGEYHLYVSYRDTILIDMDLCFDCLNDICAEGIR